ncbi:MAG: hypothetical protein HYT87_12550 [Nitrospirae bacterium]|nr:hypothetical protein [Nitrospirota bacterium]
MSGGETESVEMQLLLQGIFARYGFDLRSYDPAWLGPRIRKRVREEKVRSISGLQEKLLREGPCFNRLMQDVSGNGRRLFEPPEFFRTVRKSIAPYLRTFPFIRIWQLVEGGFEAESLAIVLREAGLADRSTIYVSRRTGVAGAPEDSRTVPVGVMKASDSAYAASGGRAKLPDYFKIVRQRAVLDSDLKDRIVRVSHHLATDSSFNEFVLIVARGVLEPFSESYKRRIFGVFHASLCLSGVIALGNAEAPPPEFGKYSYQPMEGAPHTYRRVA